MRFTARGKRRPNEHFHHLHLNIDRNGAHLFLPLSMRMVSADLVNESIYATYPKIVLHYFFYLA